MKASNLTDDSSVFAKLETIAAVVIPLRHMALTSRIVFTPKWILLHAARNSICFFEGSSPDEPVELISNSQTIVTDRCIEGTLPPAAIDR